MIGYEVDKGTEQVFKDSIGRLYIKIYVAGDPIDAGGNLTCTVTDENDATILSGVTATNDGTGIYYVDLGVANTTKVKKLYAEWSGTFQGSTQKARTHHEVIGFPIFTEAQARAFDIAQLNDASSYSESAILQERATITDLLEQWTGVAWSPRYNRAKMIGEKEKMISLPNFHINEIISVKILGETVAVSNFEIDENAGFIYRKDGLFPEATTDFPLPIVIEYEHGWDYIRNGVDRIALKLLVDRLVSTNIPDRATSFNDELGNISLVTQGGGFKNPTRIPEVNQWIEENMEKVFGV